MTKEQLTYVYCVLQRARRPSLAKTPRGLSECGKPRALDAGAGLWLLVADAPAKRFDEKTLARRLEDLDWVGRSALAHEEVIEHAMRAGAAVPMRLLTLFADDARARTAIARRRAQIERTLERVRGCREWGVRVLFDEAKTTREGRGELRRALAASSGAGYLGAKKRARELLPQRWRGARALAEQLFHELARGVSAAEKRPVASGALERRLLLDAAFLVPKGASVRFERAVASAARALRDASCELTLSGPWPPYHFVGAKR